VPVFVKQLGRHPVDEGIGAFGDGADEWKFVDKKGGDINEWPQDLRVREYPISA
jgi:hypothetical protein